MMGASRILVGEIGRPHGVRGLVKLHSFTASAADIVGYGPLWDERGTQRFVLEWLGGGIARVDGVADRDAAARLTGTRLFVERERLPPAAEDEYYLADLIGLAAVDLAGAPVGTVRAVEDFGAGAFLTLADAAGGELLIPFNRTAVPQVDVPGGRLTVVPPAEIIVRPEEAAAAGLEPDDAAAVLPAEPAPRRPHGEPRAVGRRFAGGRP